MVGPFNSPGVSDTPSRRRIFVCRPASDERTERRPAPAASPANLAAPRVPPSGDGRRRRFADAVLRRAGPEAAAGGFDAGIEQVVAAVLVSPDFLYRAIRTPETAAGSRRVPADRSGAGLAAVVLPVESGAGRGAAQDRGGGQAAATRECSRAQARRMLDDPRASSLVRNFAMKWLDLDKLERGGARPESVSDVQRPTAARLGRPKSSRSSRASCSRTATSAICSRPTTRSSTSGWRGTTASRRCSGRSSAG